MAGKWPEPSTRVVSAAFRAGPAQVPPNPMSPPMGPPSRLPAHCDLTGTMNERTGVDGQKYAIKFRLRLPVEWNGRFFMQGGGGTNGDLGDAIGTTGSGLPALAQGYAVLSQDSGHDNATNSLPERGGSAAFGLDPQARADYGGTSLPAAVLAAKAVVAAFYGAAPQHSYFFGCSKGGQEGMMLAQRYPDLFDGIVAGAPGFSLPRAAIAEAWDTQSFASVARANGAAVTPATLASSFSDDDLRIASQAVLSVCDLDDGAADGIIGNLATCTSAKVAPALRARTCAAGKVPGCLSQPQVDALVRIHEGPHNSVGDALYAPFPWDSGWADMGWRMWKIGSADGRVPALNVMMGAPSLAVVFTTPPSLPAPGLQGSLDYAMSFDFDRDAPRIHAIDANFRASAWQMIGARDPDLGAFVRRGGKLIVPHGVSDPVFSVQDTLDWWQEVDARLKGKAAQTVRVFPVPGMTHCGGGPATTDFDAFGALVDWVEKRVPPARIIATAGAGTPWPGRTRPLCPYPKTAHYRGEGDIDAASSFECR